MVSQFGDVVPSPGLFTGTPSAGQPEILYSQSAAEFHGGPLKPGQGVLRWGTAVAYKDGFYVKATTPAGVVGFLRYGVDTGSSATEHGRQGQFVMGGVLKAATLLVADNPVTDKAALATALGGMYNTANDSIRF